MCHIWNFKVELKIVQSISQIEIGNKEIVLEILRFKETGRTSFLS